MTTKQQARKAIANRFGSKQNRLDSWPAYLGNEDGTVGGSRAGYVYVRYPSVDSAAVEVYNGGVPEVAGLRIMVGYRAEQPNLIQALGVADVRIDAATVSPIMQTLKAHAPQHGYAAGDQVYINWRQIAPLGVFPMNPASLLVQVQPGYIPRPGADIAVDYQTVDLTSHVPTSGARYVLISFGDTGTVVVTDGTPNALGFSALTNADIPDTPAGNWRSAAIVLYAGQAAIVESSTEIDIYDLRFPEEQPAGSSVSTADSKDASQSINVSTADSKAISAATLDSTSSSTSDSKATSSVSSADSKDTSQSQLISTADSAAGSAGSLASDAQSSATSAGLLASTAYSAAGSGGADSVARSAADSAGLLASDAQSAADSAGLLVSDAQSAADSAGLAASTADSKAASGVPDSVAQSSAASAGLLASTAYSAAGSDGTDSVARSMADSAAGLDSTSLSNSDSKVLSLSTVTSANLTTADSKDVSQSANVSTADSKAGSAATLDSTSLSNSDSKALSLSTVTSANLTTADSKDVSQSTNVSTTQSVGASAATLDSTSLSNSDSKTASGVSTANSKDTSQSTVASTADSKAVSDATARPAAANPTASVALTATNGSAASFMRSDAAPALDVTIVPTWTGVHTFSNVTDSSSVSTGAIHTTGGAGIAKMLNVGTFLGVGVAASANYGIYVSKTFTSTTGVKAGIDSITDYDPSGASSATGYGGLFEVNVPSGNAQTITYLNGFRGDVSNSGTGSIVTADGVTASVVNSSSGSIGTARAMYAQSNTNGGGTITTSIGLDVGGQEAGTTNFAIRTSTGQVKFGDVTDSSSATTGALVVSGGVGIAKSLYVEGASSFFGGDAVAATALNINGTAGTSRDYRWYTAGSLRWIMRANGTAESGSNVGTDFQLLCRTDAGAALFTTMTMYRSTGQTSFQMTTDSTSSTTGAMVTAGGIGIAKALTVGTGFGCNSKTPQTAYASGGAVTPGAGAYGFSSAANAAALATLVANIRAALVANGIMS